MPLLDFASKSFLTQWVWEPTRGENILGLAFTTKDDIVEGIKVGEDLGSNNHKMVCFNFQVPDLATGRRRIQKKTSEEQT